MKTLFHEEELKALECFKCGEDLLHPPKGHLIFKEEGSNGQYTLLDVKWVCSSCDQRFYMPSKELWLWKDISDLFIPEMLISWILGIIKDLYKKETTFSDEAMENIFKFLLIVFPHISKELTASQKEELENLYTIPRFLGGLG